MAHRKNEERDEFIATLWDPEKRNQAAIAKRFNLSKVRVGQIIKEQMEKGTIMPPKKKYDAKLSSTNIQKEKLEALQKLAVRKDMPIASLIRQGVTLVLAKYAQEQSKPKP